MLGIRNSASTLSRNSPKIQVFMFCRSMMIPLCTKLILPPSWPLSQARRRHPGLAGIGWFRMAQPPEAREKRVPGEEWKGMVDCCS